jgi:hypothetical protein
LGNSGILSLPVILPVRLLLLRLLLMLVLLALVPVWEEDPGDCECTGRGPNIIATIPSITLRETANATTRRQTPVMKNERGTGFENPLADVNGVQSIISRAPPRPRTSDWQSTNGKE